MGQQLRSVAGWGRTHRGIPHTQIQTFGNGQGGTPLITKDVQTDASVGVDVGVMDTRGEVHLGRLEGVVGGEMDSQEEDAARVGTLTLPKSYVS